MIDKIEKLKKEKNAVILAHNYEPPEIQDIADMCGDSLKLSIKVAKTSADVIVFCGVSFMAETASILSPDKIVLLPRSDAGCPMADMITPESLKAKLKDFPDNIPVVSYVNTHAAVKALSTICCTSANAIEVVNSLNAAEILMTPDKNLAKYTEKNTHVKIHFWEGYCPIHNNLKAQDIIIAKAKYPDAVVIAHPECPSEVLELSDVITSTSGMIKYAKESDQKSFIIGTEIGLLYPLKKEMPDKNFYPAAEKMMCPDMKKITLEDVAHSLETMNGQVEIPEDIRIPALSAVQKMLDLS